MSETRRPTIADRSVRPRVVAVGTGFGIAAAALNAVIGSFFLSQVLLATRGAGAPPAGVIGASVVLALIALAYGIAVAVLAVLTFRGRAWARSGFFAVSALSLFPIVVSFSYPVVAVAVLLVVADVLFYRSSVTRWYRALRGLPPG